MAASVIYSVETNDQIVAQAGEYIVIIRIEDQSGIAILGKLNDVGKTEIVARSEDIVSQIEKLVPPMEALQLATQIVKREISRQGGTGKAQEIINANAKKFGSQFYNYLTPLSINAYKTNGVIIPIENRQPEKQKDR